MKKYYYLVTLLLCMAGFILPGYSTIRFEGADVRKSLNSRLSDVLQMKFGSQISDRISRGLIGKDITVAGVARLVELAFCEYVRGVNNSCFIRSKKSEVYEEIAKSSSVEILIDLESFGVYHPTHKEDLQREVSVYCQALIRPGLGHFGKR